VADVFSKSKRSEVMSKIRSRGNRETELLLAGIFRKNKIKGWRRHLPIFGRPDFVFSHYKIAIFVDGCFWHGCPKHGRTPKSNQVYWKAKITKNKLRDKLTNRHLRKSGWCVLRFWQHELHNEKKIIKVVASAFRDACKIENQTI
jgi:DNA mismatch endonuclease, patch repair protein